MDELILLLSAKLSAALGLLLFLFFLFSAPFILHVYYSLPGVTLFLGGEYLLDFGSRRSEVKAILLPKFVIILDLNGIYFFAFKATLN